MPTRSRRYGEALAAGVPWYSEVGSGWLSLPYYLRALSQGPEGGNSVVLPSEDAFASAHTLMAAPLEEPSAAARRRPRRFFIEKE